MERSRSPSMPKYSLRPPTRRKATTLTKLRDEINITAPIESGLEMISSAYTHRHPKNLETEKSMWAKAADKFVRAYSPPSDCEISKADWPLDTRKDSNAYLEVDWTCPSVPVFEKSGWQWTMQEKQAMGTSRNRGELTEEQYRAHERMLLSKKPHKKADIRAVLIKNGERQYQTKFPSELNVTWTALRYARPVVQEAERLSTLPAKCDFTLCEGTSHSTGA